MTESKPKLRELAGHHEVSSSVCTPGVRTVILTVHRDEHAGAEPTFYREVIPVLAIEARVVETWVKMQKDKDEFSLIFSTPDEFERRGYRIRSREVELRPVFVSDEDWIGLQSDPHGGVASNGKSKMVPCPWGWEEDGDRLEPLFQDLEKEFSVDRPA